MFANSELPHRRSKAVRRLTASKNFTPPFAIWALRDLNELLDALQQRTHLAPTRNRLGGIAAVLEGVLIALRRPGRFASM